MLFRDALLSFDQWCLPYFHVNDRVTLAKQWLVSGMACGTFELDSASRGCGHAAETVRDTTRIVS